MGKRMTIEEIHVVNLLVLLALDAYCKGHQIRYFLDSGTLIGAVRHHGFIPWDDDSDIVMPRPDFDRFVREFVDTEKYKLYAHVRGNCFMPYARLCEVKNTRFGQKSPWTREDPGVGVDIFPLDGAPDAEADYDSFVAEFIKVRDRIWRLRKAISQMRPVRKDVVGFIKDVGHRIADVWYRIWFDKLMRTALKKADEILHRYDYEQSNFCCSISFRSDRYVRWEKKWFARVVDLEICGKRFSSPIGYDERLRHQYGDYMTPPPTGDRGGHVALQEMYWR